MSQELDIVFLDSQCLGAPHSVEGIIEVFSSAGFEIGSFEIDGDSAGDWAEYCAKPDALMRRAYSAEQLSFVAYHADRHFEALQQVAWGMRNLGGARRAWVRTSTDNTPYFWRSEYHCAGYSRFYLDIGRRIYAVLRPSFGWVDFNYGLRTTHEDIEALALPALYWANFFGPTYVKKVGRHRITRAPAFCIEDLPDGGLLYTLASCPGLASDHVPPGEVAAAFGVERVR